MSFMVIYGWFSCIVIRCIFIYLFELLRIILLVGRVIVCFLGEMLVRGGLFIRGVYDKN